MCKILTLLPLFLFAFSLDAQQFQDSLTVALESHFRESGLPGFAVAVVDGEGVLYQNAFGFAHKERKIEFEVASRLNVGSVSKTAVGLALVKAVEQGALTFDTEINSLLPFEIKHPRFPDQPILIRHLVNHSSGILDGKYYRESYISAGFQDESNVHQGYLSFLESHKERTLEDFLFQTLHTDGEWYSRKNFTKSVPGTARNYANLNAALVAHILELATGITFEQYTEEQIFGPLRMTSTSWRVGEGMDSLATRYFPSGAIVPNYRLITYPDGGLQTNVVDLSLFLSEMIRAYEGRSEFLETSYAKLLLPGDEDGNRAFWGMGVKSRNIGHGGSDPGVQADFQFNADSRIGRVILTNVNAEDNPELWSQFRKIHTILAQFEEVLTRD